MVGSKSNRTPGKRRLRGTSLPSFFFPLNFCPRSTRNEYLMASNFILQNYLFVHMTKLTEICESCVFSERFYAIHADRGPIPNFLLLLQKLRIFVGGAFNNFPTSHTERCWVCVFRWVIKPLK